MTLLWWLKLLEWEDVADGVSLMSFVNAWSCTRQSSKYFMGLVRKNKVADRLADIAHRHRTTVEVRSREELSREALQAYTMNLLGIWSLRI